MLSRYHQSSRILPARSPKKSHAAEFACLLCVRAVLTSLFGPFLQDTGRSSPNPARALDPKEPYRGSHIPILCCPNEPVLRDTSPSRHQTEFGSCPCAHPTMCPPNTRCLDDALLFLPPFLSSSTTGEARTVRVAATLWNVCRVFGDDVKQTWQAAFTCSELSDQLTEMLLGTRDRSFIWKHLLPFCGDSAERDGCYSSHLGRFFKVLDHCQYNKCKCR